MAGRTSIEWTADGEEEGASWNPIRGCEMVSQGCKNCYAMRIAAHPRLSGPGKAYEGLTEEGPNGPRWNGAIKLVPDELLKPLRWRKPRTVFVNSMTDLFWRKVPDEYIDLVFAVMAAASWHRYIILTKRADRMWQYLSDPSREATINALGLQYAAGAVVKQPLLFGSAFRWPLPHVVVGVSAERQEEFDQRVPFLLTAPIAVRMVSLEPLLGPILMNGGGRNFLEGESIYGAFIDWIVSGGESGQGARPMLVTWLADLVDEAKRYGVPMFVKQLGAFAAIDHRDQSIMETSKPWPKHIAFTKRKFGDGSRWLWRPTMTTPKGNNPKDWPEALRVREVPALLAA
jgi:protein gp37